MKRTINKIVSAGTFLVVGLFSICVTACNPKNEIVQEGISVILDYNDDGQSRSRTVYLYDGGSMSEPDVPERTGYQFVCWQTEKDGGETISFPYTPKDGTVLYASWEAQECKVIFDYNYEGSEPYVMTTTYSNTVSAPVNPERENYNFRYWRSKPDGGNPITFPYTVRKDTTFYAYWLEADIKIFTINFDANYDGCESLPSVEVEEGSYLKETPKITRQGYVLDGWATSSDGTPVEMPYKPTENITLYAVWSVQKYKVNFNYNYKSAPNKGIYETVEVAGTTQISAPEVNPERKDYIFDGWYASSEGGEVIEFPVTVFRATNYYAHWTHIPVKTDIFDAEFTYFDPQESFPGYSGEVNGRDVVQLDTTGLGAKTLHADNSTTGGYYVSYLYKQGATVRYVINSSKAVSGVSLYVSLSIEPYAGNKITITPTGDYGYQFIVNGRSIDYGSTTLSYGPFKEYLISSNIELKAGENVIELETNNDTPMGGTMTATSPIVDYVRLDQYGSSELTWSPIYDNLI